MDRAEKGYDNTKYHRPLSGIGIEDIFLHIPSNINSESIECKGLVKSKPEDFIVKEITTLLGSSGTSVRKIATLTDSWTLPLTQDKQNTFQNGIENTKEQIFSETKSKSESPDPSIKKPKTMMNSSNMEKANENQTFFNTEQAKMEINTANKHENVEDETKIEKNSHTPLEQIQQFLSAVYLITDQKSAYPDEEAYLNKTMESIAKIYDFAKAQIIETTQNNIEQTSNSTVSYNKLQIRSPSDIKEISTSDESDYNITELRTKFHKAIRKEFPFLKTITAVETSSSNEDNEDNMNDDEMKSRKENKTNENKFRIIDIDIDDMFFELIPYLYSPAQDLLQLYQFRNNGLVGDLPLPTNGRGNRGKRTQGRLTEPKKEIQESNVLNDNVVREVLLRIKPTIDNKEVRRKLHHIISSKFSNFETMTRSIPHGSSYITTIVVHWSRNAFRKKQRKKRKNHSNSTHMSHNKTSHDFITQCVLQKRQVEHLECIQRLTYTLRCRSSDIGMAGIKDMCAVTSQIVTFRNISAKKLRFANDKLKRFGIQLGNFQHVDFFQKDGSKTNMLQKGDLSGNEFSITLRNLQILSHDSSHETLSHYPIVSQIDEMVKRVQSHGFINYYGEQRVGEAGPSDKVGIRSLDIGRAMLQEKYNVAIDYLMKGRDKTRRPTDNPNNQEWVPVESKSVRDMRALWKSTNDPSEVLQYIKNKKFHGLTRERTVLQGLKRYGKDHPLKALQCLHFNIRFFWINAYQSYVWNIAATKRIQRYGLQTVIGDLYIPNCEGEDKMKSLVKVVTTEELARSVSLSSVVLPLPGHDIIYPTNEIGDLYSEILKEDNIIFDKCKAMESTARGSYRKMISKAHNLQWKPIFTEESKENQDKCAQTETRKEESQRSVSSAIFSFQLDTGCYATMMLRELLQTRLSKQEKVTNVQLA